MAMGTVKHGPFEVARMPRYRTMADIKQSNRDAGEHFFDRATMRFFDSRIEAGGPYKGAGGVYFVTSEQFHGSGGYSEPRKYTVRRFDTSTGEVSTAGKFNEISTLSDARFIARGYAASGMPQVSEVL